MATKIRLSRRGRKKNPFYHIVVADARHPRDGRFIERIGTYNPMTNPAEISLQFDRALYWLQVGAQPTHTCRAILSYKGVLLKNHLLEGVKKGAFDEEIAEQKFKEWMIANENKIELKKDKLRVKKESQKKEQLAKESAINLERAKKLAAEKAEATEELVKEISGEAKDENAKGAEQAAEPITENVEKIEAPSAETAATKTSKSSEESKDEKKKDSPDTTD